MQVPDAILIFLAAASLVILRLLFSRDLLDKLIEELNNFRGGPPTAMHPSPADDSRLLLRRSRKNANLS